MRNYALRTSAFICNRCYLVRIKATHYELFMFRKPKMDHVQELGMNFFVYVQNKTKLDALADADNFLGNCPVSRACLVYFPENHEVRRIRYVQFHQEILEEQSKNRMIPRLIPQTPIIDVENPDENHTENYHSTENISGNTENCYSDLRFSMFSQEDNNGSLRYSQRDHRHPNYFGNYVNSGEAIFFRRRD